LTSKNLAHSLVSSKHTFIKTFEISIFMNFQDLQKIEDYQFYLDQAFKQSKKHGNMIFLKSNGDMFSRVMKSEQEKLKLFSKTLMSYMDNIYKKFPSIDGLPEIYSELVRLTLDYDFLKKSLGSLKWLSEKIHEISGYYMRRLRSCRSEDQVKRVMNEYYGRTSSLMKQVSKHLKYIEDARKIMKNYPTLKTDLYTIAIAGFPNIGKSTLLAKLTPAKPEIKDYAFTTKQLNQGYAWYGARKIQFVDTPGVLDREKMNNIELQAYLIMKYLASLIIYVIDLTEPYPLKKQEELLKKLKEEHDTPIIVYLSKTDILEKAKFEKAKKKYRAVISVDELNKKIEKSIKNY